MNKGSNPNTMKDYDKRIAQLESDLKELALTVDKVEDEKLLLKNQLIKALADYSNLERDIEKRVDNRSIQIKLQIARVMLNVLDDVNFAIVNSASLEMSEEVKKWVEGVKATMFDIEKAIGEFSITKMETKKGDQFDSSRHEALGTVPEGVAGTIYEIVQPGFMLNDIIVRPARVIISQPKI